MLLEPSRNLTFEALLNKRVTTVTHSSTTRTYVECCTLCLVTDGCLAASVRQDNNGVMCNLSNSIDTEEDTTTTTYKNGEYEGRFNN